MKHAIELFFRIALWVFTWLIWLWALNQPLSNIMNLCIIVGGVLLVFPLVWLGRKMIDRQPTTSRASWITMFVHYALGILFGVTIIRAVITHQDWSGWALPGRAGGSGNRNKVFLLPSPPPADPCTKDNKNIDGRK